MLAKKNKYELVIIGAGLSGAAAAAEAGERGVDTLVIEKGRSTGGTGNYVEGVFAVESELQEKQGVELTKHDIFKIEYNWSHALANMAVWRDYIAQSAENVTWLQKHGAKITHLRHLGKDENTWHLFDGHGKAAINEGLLPFAKKQGVEIITSAKAIRLELDAAGQISGLKIQDFVSGKKQFIQTKNVIIATGGYLNNPEMLDTNNNHNGHRIVAVNSGKNTGDGLKLAWSVGAKQFGMGMAMMFGGQVYDPATPGYKNWMRQINRAATHEAGLWVNEQGERFANEDCTDVWAIAGNTLIRQNKVYAIFDQKQIDDLATHSFKGNFKYDQLKSDLSDDLKAKKPYLHVAESISELANKLSLPALINSVRRYNDLAKIGQDLDFDKDNQYLHTLTTGPFYAIELGVGAFCTMGGLRTNTRNEVLDENGSPIPGLYAIGTDGSAVLVGDTYGVNVAGSEAGYCIYSGRNAVKNIDK